MRCIDPRWLVKRLDCPRLYIHASGDAEPRCTKSSQGRAAGGDCTLSGGAPRSVPGRAASRRSHGRAGAQRSTRGRCERAKRLPGPRDACWDCRGLAVCRNPSPAPDSTATRGALGCGGWKMCCFAVAVSCILLLKKHLNIDVCFFSPNLRRRGICPTWLFGSGIGVEAWHEHC